MKREGFTLIELLAVIVILAIIALISTPIIIGVIDKSRKGAFEDSAYGVLDAGRLYVVNKIADDNAFTGRAFNFARNVDSLKLSGDKPAGGRLVLDSDGKQGLAVWGKDKRWCAYKDFDEEKITLKEYVEGDCKVTVNWNAVQYITGKNTTGNAEGLISDDKGNIRYAGNNTVVKNYVRYNNEEWRIIGVFDGKLKLIKGEIAGYKQWSDSTTSNNWVTSVMQDHLNGEYYNSLTSEAKNMIEETKYYLGGTSTSYAMKEVMYDYERGTKVYAGNPTEWTGKIGLMYPSDYGYAASSECTQNLSGYNNTTCINNNWMYLASRSTEWFITTYSGTNSHALYMIRSGGVQAYSDAVTNAYMFRPVLYIKANTSITSGDGTQGDPYLLE